MLKYAVFLLPLVISPALMAKSDRTSACSNCVRVVSIGGPSGDYGAAWTPISVTSSYGEHNETLSILDCECGLDIHCYWKCCPSGSAIDLKTKRCEHHVEEGVSSENHVAFCPKKCPTGMTFYFSVVTLVNLPSLRSPEGLVSFPSNISCIDYSDSTQEFTVAVCEATKFTGYKYPSPVMPALIVVALVISFLSLTVSFVVYSYFSELRNLHGKCLLCHMASLILYYIVITVRRNRSALMRKSGATCFVLDFLRHVFYLASFSWLNVTCFDISLSFLFLKPNIRHFRGTERMKFICYSLYAWLTPVIGFIASLFIDFNSAGLEISDINIGKWCQEKRVTSAMYRYIPMCLFTVFSAVLFIATATKIWRINRSTSILREDETTRHQSTHEKNKKKRFRLYVKLLVVMGLFSWILEPTLWSVREWVLADRTDFRSTIWFIMLVIRNLNGLYISLVFLCNNKVRRLVMKRMGRTPETTSSSGLSKSCELSNIKRRKPTNGSTLSLQSNSANRDAFG